MFNQRLKQLREKKGLSQAGMARYFRVAQSTVGNWESGIREPDLDTITHIADFFEVSVDYLLGKTADPTPSPPLSEDDEVWQLREILHTRPEMKTLFKMSSRASREDVERTIKIIEALNPDKE